MTEACFAAGIVLSAGTYGSAAILLRSGIGPQAALAGLDISLVADLPVGQRVKDHPFYYLAYATKKETPTDPSPTIATQLWTASTLAKAQDLHITASHLFPHALSPTGMGFALGTALTRPLSEGKLWLESKDPAAVPCFDLNMAAHPDDLRRLVEIARIGETAPFADFVAMELVPAGSTASKSWPTAAAASSLLGSRCNVLQSLSKHLYRNSKSNYLHGSDALTSSVRHSILTFLTS